MPMTLTPNHDKNSEMNSTTVATPAIRSARDQRAASNLYAGIADALGAAAADAAGAGALTDGASWVPLEPALSDAPQLGQALASSAASLRQCGQVCGMAPPSILR